MSSERDLLVVYGLETENFRYFIDSSIVEAVTSENPSHTKRSAFENSVFHDGLAEVVGASRRVQTVLSKEWGEKFLVTFYRNQVYFPCNVFAHVLKIPSVGNLFNQGFD